mmetsp:Transcript_15345/g.39514  ORF Transcript_15345/g.39514 Transcript_15345/m.39514 type:complete len:221 (-) Transcript_15345:46-708(-)
MLLVAAAAAATATSAAAVAIGRETALSKEEAVPAGVAGVAAATPTAEALAEAMLLAVAAAAVAVAATIRVVAAVATEEAAVMVVAAAVVVAGGRRIDGHLCTQTLIDRCLLVFTPVAAVPQACPRWVKTPAIRLPRGLAQGGGASHSSRHTADIQTRGGNCNEWLLVPLLVAPAAAPAFSPYVAGRVGGRALLPDSLDPHRRACCACCRTSTRPPMGSMR